MLKMVGFTGYKLYLNKAVQKQEEKKRTHKN